MYTKCNPFKAQCSSMTVFRIELCLLQLQRNQFAASASECSKLVWEEEIILTGEGGCQPAQEQGLCLTAHIHTQVWIWSFFRRSPP